MFDNKYITAIE